MTDKTTREVLLEMATQYVTKDRQADHGNPENTFGLIAEYWSTYLSKVLSPADVSALLILLKVARSQMNPAHFDNWIDMAGYAACGGELSQQSLGVSDGTL